MCVRFLLELALWAAAPPIKTASKYIFSPHSFSFTKSFLLRWGFEHLFFFFFCSFLFLLNCCARRNALCILEQLTMSFFLSLSLSTSPVLILPLFSFPPSGRAGFWVSKSGESGFVAKQSRKGEQFRFLFNPVGGGDNKSFSFR